MLFFHGHTWQFGKVPNIRYWKTKYFLSSLYKRQEYIGVKIKVNMDTAFFLKIIRPVNVDEIRDRRIEPPQTLTNLNEIKIAAARL